MKLVVCLKQVPSTDSRIKPTADSKSADLDSVEWVLNPYDEIALEAAIQIKEKHGGEVVVVSVGGDKVEEAMRQALALGADSAEVVKDASLSSTDALVTARILAALVKRHQPDLVFCGKQAVDDDRMAVPAMLAELLDLPQVTVVVKFEVSEDGSTATAEREIEGGHEVIEVQLPAVIATQKGLNEPRYANLKGIMKAKKKPLGSVTLEELGVTVETAPIEVLEVTPPPEKSGARMIEGDPDQQVAELLKVLHEEERLI